jgi:hypothetical protein
MNQENNKYNDFDPYVFDSSDGDNSEDFDNERSDGSRDNSSRDSNSYGSDGYSGGSRTDDDSRNEDDSDDNSYDSYDEHGNKRYDSDGNSYYSDDREKDEYYYDEDYPEEEFYHDEQDEEDRRKRSRLRRAWICCIVLLCCLLILIILLIVFLLSRDKNVTPIPTSRPTYAPMVIETDDDFYYDDDIILAPGVLTTPMAPFNRDNCEITEGVAFAGEYRNILDQCACGQEIVDIPPDVMDIRDLIIERVAPKFYGENFSIPWTSCDPANMAAVWLASGDNRDAGEPRQRYASALTYYQLNGTVWDFMDGWMTPLNECLWMGIQCNNRDAMNSLALDTNNLFGPVRTIDERNAPVRYGCSRSCLSSREHIHSLIGFNLPLSHSPFSSNNECVS